MLNGLAATMIVKIAAKGWVTGTPSVVDMGNQTFAVRPETLESLRARWQAEPRQGWSPDFAAFDALKAEKRTSTITWLRETGGAELQGVIANERTDAPVSMTERFYRALGYVSYDAIDVNSRYGSLMMDLNKDLSEAYGFSRRFGLVINNGTSEHLAGQAAFMKNAHDLTADGGVMLHVLPWGGYVNHGFFNYQPILFLDLAAANGYEVLELLVGDQNGVLKDLRVKDDQNVYFYPWLDALAGNEVGNTLLVAALRKRTHAPFVLPMQGKYIGDVESEEVKGRYVEQPYAKRPTKGLYFPDDNARTRSRAFRAKLRIKLGLLKVLRRLTSTIMARLWPTL